DRVLLRESEIVPLTPKAFETLLALVERSGHVVDKDELMRAVWPDTFVEEGGLTRNISVLRKALGDAESGRGYIETVPKRGYRFLGEVRDVTAEAGEIVLKRHTRSRILVEQETSVEVGRASETAMLSRSSRKGSSTRARAATTLILALATTLALYTY